jgi:hypothetical protein
MVDEPIAAVPETSAVPAYIAKQRRILDQEVAKYSVMNKHFANYVDRLDPVDINDYFHRELNGNEYSSEGFKDFLIKKEGESSIEYFDRINYGDGYAAVLKNLVEPRKRGFFLKYGKKIGVQAQDEMEDLLSDIFDLKNMIYIKRMEVEKLNQGLEGKAAKADVANDVYIDPEKPDQVPDLVGKKQATSIPTDTSLDIDDVEDDEFLQESNLPEFTPIKGKNVDSENKKESKSATSEEGEEAEESQETIDQKVDNLKNQKYELNKTEDGTAEKLHGWRNNLDLDYKNGLTDDQKKRFEDQASGMAPKDHANVDHDSTGGEKLIKAAKARTEGGENSINQSDYTSRVDRTNIEKKSEYEKTGVFNESIERMKKLFDYEANEISQNKTNKDKDENDVLFESVKTKKFI